MTIKSKNIDKEIAKLPYDKPSFHKYGTMKELTFQSGGSNGDSFGAGNMPPEGGDPKPFKVNNADTGGGVNSDNQGNNTDDFATITNNDS